MNDNFYGVQDIRRSTSADLSKGIVVCPLLSFYFSFFLIYYYFLYFCGLNGSFYLTLICPLWDLLICPLWDLLICPLWDLFLTLGATLYILQKVEDLSHFTKYSNHKEDVTIMMYANVCLCQGSRI